MTARKNIWILTKVFWFYILPILLVAFLLFPSEKIELGRTTQTVDIGNETINRTYVYVDSKSHLTENRVVLKIFKIEVDAPVYDICFEDKGSYIGYFDGSREQFPWRVNFNNQFNLTVFPNNTNCTLLDSNQNYTYNWISNSSLKFSEELYRSYKESGKRPYAHFHANTTSYARQNFVDWISTVLIFVVAWIGIWYLLIKSLDVALGNYKKSLFLKKEEKSGNT